MSNLEPPLFVRWWYEWYVFIIIDFLSFLHLILFIKTNKLKEVRSQSVCSSLVLTRISSTSYKYNETYSELLVTPTKSDTGRVQKISQINYSCSIFTEKVTDDLAPRSSGGPPNSESLEGIGQIPQNLFLLEIRNPPRFRAKIAEQNRKWSLCKQLKLYARLRVDLWVVYFWIKM